MSELVSLQQFSKLLGPKIAAVVANITSVFKAG